jgi:hypothetical protein
MGEHPDGLEERALARKVSLRRPRALLNGRQSGCGPASAAEGCVKRSKDASWGEYWLQPISPEEIGTAANQGLAFETWDPPRKVRFGPQNVASGEPHPLSKARLNKDPTSPKLRHPYTRGWCACRTRLISRASAFVFNPARRQDALEFFFPCASGNAPVLHLYARDHSIHGSFPARGRRR